MMKLWIFCVGVGVGGGGNHKIELLGGSFIYISGLF